MSGMMAPEEPMPNGPQQSAGMDGMAPEDMSFMQQCVAFVMDKGQDEDAAVSICMSQLQQQKQATQSMTLAGGGMAQGQPGGGAPAQMV